MIVCDFVYYSELNLMKCDGAVCCVYLCPRFSFCPVNQSVHKPYHWVLQYSYLMQNRGQEVIQKMSEILYFRKNRISPLLLGFFTLFLTSE